MVNLDEAIIAKLRKGGKNFEILVDCDKALELKKGKDVDIWDVLATTFIFNDVKKAERASEKDLQEVFSTENVEEIAVKIIKEGEIQITTEHKNKAREEKLKRIVDLIQRNSVDSKTGLPHSVQRIKNAIEEAGIKVSENKKAEEQIDEIVEKIRPILPLKFEKKTLELRIPIKFSSQAYNLVKKYSKVLKDNWGSNSLLIKIEVPSGIIDEFFSELNAICHGEVESKIIEN